MDLNSLLINYLNCIDAKNKNVINYVSIGCTNRQTFNKQLINIDLLENEDQQYPLFLRKIKRNVSDISLNLFLIDPTLELIPACIRKSIPNSTKVINELEIGWVLDKEINMEFAPVAPGSTFRVVSGAIYVNSLENIKIFALKSSVNFAPFDIQTHQNDITQFFEILNQKSIENNWLTFISDFTGKTDMSSTKRYFQSQIHGHKDKIIYGLFSGINNLCLKDMRTIDFHFVTDHNGIHVVNPDNFTNMTELVSCVDEILSTHTNIIVLEKLKEFVFDLVNHVVQILCPLIRQLQLCLNGQIIKLNLNKELIYYDDFKKAYNYGNYYDMYGIILRELQNHLEKIYECSQRVKCENIINNTMSLVVNTTDPYKILDVLNKEINEVYLYNSWIA